MRTRVLRHHSWVSRMQALWASGDLQCTRTYDRTRSLRFLYSDCFPSSDGVYVNSPLQTDTNTLVNSCHQQY